MGINKNFLPLKGHYFLFNAGTAPVVPFMPVFARQLGFSTTVVGAVYTILPIVGMLAKPLFGAIADRFQRQKLLFLLFQLLTAVAFFGIMFIPSIPQAAPVELHCNLGASDLKYCPPKGEKLNSCIVDNIVGADPNATIKCDLDCQMEPWMWDIVCDNWNIKCPQIKSSSLQFAVDVRPWQSEQLKDCLELVINHAVFPDNVENPMYCPRNDSMPFFVANCEAKCNNPILTELITQTKIPNHEVTELYQFWLLFFFLVASWAGMAVVVSVGDAICFEMLGDDHHLYGNQRLWGAVGWGIFSVIAGVLVDKFSKGQYEKDYTVVFYMMLVVIILDMIVSSKLKYTQTKLSTNILKDVGNIFTSVKVVIFFLWCIGVGLCTALIWNFLFWHLEDLAGRQEGCDHMVSMKTLQGIVMGIQCFGGELPFFFLSGWILKKIGHVHAMSLVLLGFGVRFILYSMLQNPWWVLPIEFLNGVTFGIFYSTMASYASIVAPAGTETTIQGLVGAVFEGIGVSTGSFIAGISFDRIGGSSTFRYFGIGALLCFLIHIIVQYYLENIRGKIKKEISENAQKDHNLSIVFTDSKQNVDIKNSSIENKSLTTVDDEVVDNFKEIDLRT